MQCKGSKMILNFLSKHYKGPNIVFGVKQNLMEAMMQITFGPANNVFSLQVNDYRIQAQYS